MIDCAEAQSVARQIRVKALVDRLDELVDSDGFLDAMVVAEWVDGLLRVQRAEFLMTLDRVLQEELDG